MMNTKTKRGILLRQFLALSIVVAMIFAIMPFATRGDDVIYEPEYPPIVEDVVVDDETEEIGEVEAEPETGESEETQLTVPEVDIPVLEETEEIEIDEELIVPTEYNSFETMTWNEGYTAPGVGVVATMAVRADALAILQNQPMRHQSQWRNSLINNGNWQTTAITVADFNTIRSDADPANRIIHVFTPYYGPGATSGVNTVISLIVPNTSFSSILPDIQADVTVDMCSSITDVGDFFMANYANGAGALRSLGVPDTNNITNIGDGFMVWYASRANALISLGVPNTSNIKSVGASFMMGYAVGAISLTGLGVPDTSNLTSAGSSFMMSYAVGATSLTSLGAPDTSGLTIAHDYFMSNYASGATSLTNLGIPDTSNMTNAGIHFMSGYASWATSLTSLDVPNTSSMITIGNAFMSDYARGATSLTNLDAPDTSNITGTGAQFMAGYARGTTSLLSIGLPDITAMTWTTRPWNLMHDFAENTPNLEMLVATSGAGPLGLPGTNAGDFNFGVSSCRLGILQITAPEEYVDEWITLTTTDRFLYRNYIRSAGDVIGQEPEPTPTPTPEVTPTPTPELTPTPTPEVTPTPTPDDGYGDGGMNGNGEGETSDNGTGSPQTGDFSALMLGASSLIALAGVGRVVKAKKRK